MNTNQTQNDLSLLREFNLEAAKAGDLLTDLSNSNEYKMLDYVIRGSTGEVLSVDVQSTCKDAFVYEDTEVQFIRMKPLCLVEGKPVYKGDVLYGKNYSEYKYIASHFAVDLLYTTPNETDSCRELLKNLTWNKPKQKVKRKVWINVYSKEAFSYPSKEAADYKADMESRIACVETEIEYEV